MPYSTKTISATGLVQITSGARDVVSTAVVTISGFTGSLTFQSRHNNDGNGANTLVPGNVGYSILGGASVAAGTAITTDGRFEVVTDGSDLYFNVTAITGSFTYYLTSLQGGGGGAGSGGGGGGGGAATIANGADVAEGSTTDAPAASPTTTAAATTISLLKQIANNTSSATSNTVVPTSTVDPTNSFTQPTGDAAGRSIFMVAQGLVADGSTGTTSSAVLIGGNDSGGLVRTGLMSLLTAAPTGSAVYGLTTFSQVAALGTGNVARGMVSGQGLSDAASGSTSMATATIVWNGTTWDRATGSAAAGRIVKPYALPGNDWMYAGATGGITNTTGVTMKAAAGGSLRNYVTAIQVENSSATATEVVVNDGAAGTAIWRGWVPATSGVLLVTFPTPLKGTANTLTEVACVTTGTATRVSAQGYAAA